MYSYYCEIVQCIDKQYNRFVCGLWRIIDITIGMTSNHFVLRGTYKSQIVEFKTYPRFIDGRRLSLMVRIMTVIFRTNITIILQSLIRYASYGLIHGTIYDLQIRLSR